MLRAMGRISSGSESGTWRTHSTESFRVISQALSREIPPDQIDLVVCPGTAFDPACRRMGMGGGYYDRFLPKCTRARIVMVAFEAQKVDEIPADAWDQPVEQVFTEDRIYAREGGC